MLNWKENYEYRKNYLKIKVTHSCDICNKNSSYSNRTCNKCFYKLMSDDYEM
ncbi:MAG: hypothetical protein PPFGHCPK_00921 [Spiroplasma endosymbiont of Drosophila atripex]|nr:MAG: hypothetical protein PPFGHCPK_00195 [Spiroplasma endosymbiont of Drosophila atripex]WDA54020.1 MAG: hypothetical protein PPFGHCPK_00436 [Spiroplasma endosymbiont of Drosophila atripex]WDA54474.1 MAG: hypothetical protein PPFGHCPK_00921 [Spiroplasma endosymbiont of Drosophila atripex]